MSALTAKQVEAIAALLSEKDTKAAAKKAKVGYSTLRGWMDLPDFEARLKAERNKLLDGLVTNLVRIGGAATAALERGLDKKQPIQVQVRAARGVLDQLVKLAPLADLVVQLNALRLELAGLNANRDAMHPRTGPHPVAGAKVGGAGSEPGTVGFIERPDPAVQTDGLAGRPVAGEVPDLAEGDEELPPL